MSKAFAIVLGICFTALGLATLFFAIEDPSIYRFVVGPLFFVTGIACFFYREPPIHRRPG